jgi:uncharacterized membrane protein (TIGR02234 family)
VPDTRRRTFGPVVLVGVAAGIALAMAGTEPWFSGEDLTVCESPCTGLSWADAGIASSANALALVSLASWGVLLVTRGRVRRVVSVLGLLAAIGALVTVVVSWFTLPDNVRDAFEELSIEPVPVHSTGWFWVGATAAVLGLVAWVAAVRFVRDWPEMGRRYDTPSDSPPEDLWKALDQGHDPTS